MKVSLIILIAFSVFLTSCGNSSPFAAQIELALNDIFKAKNHDAVVKVNSTHDLDDFYTEFTFTCTNCLFEWKHSDAPPVIVPSSEGHGMLTLNKKLQRWKFNQIYVSAPDVGKVSYESDYIF